MSPKTIKTNHINIAAKIKVHRDMGDIWVGTNNTSTNHTKFLCLTTEYRYDLRKTYRRGHKETEYSLLYDKKYKTTGVYEDINKYLSFIFPFYYVIWTDVLGNLVICGKGFQVAKESYQID
jgi:hypothetical protein